MSDKLVAHPRRTYLRLVHISRHINRNLQIFLQRIITSTTTSRPMLMFTNRTFNMVFNNQIQYTVNITFRDSNQRTSIKYLNRPLFRHFMLHFTLSRARAPTVIRRNSNSIVQIIRHHHTTIRHNIIGNPFQQHNLPSRLNRIVTVFHVANLTTLYHRMRLMPPLRLNFKQRQDFPNHLITSRVAASHRRHLCPLQPRHHSSVHQAYTPIMTTRRNFISLRHIRRVSSVANRHHQLTITRNFIKRRTNVTVATHVQSRRPVALNYRRQHRVTMTIGIMEPTIRRGRR